MNLAVEDFRKHDFQLLEISADERAATHRIACYLQKYFPGWNVDCEYNRRGRNPKKLDGELVRPDIIIHRRNSRENLLCIEAKKSGGSLDELDDDRKRLAEFTQYAGEYKYPFGLLIILSLTTPYKIDYEWYKNGKTIKSC